MECILTELHNVLNRRSFIKSSAGIILGGSIPSIGLGTAKARKITIIGAGLSGLSCAINLQNAGYEVKVLEASRQAGGRVKTQYISGIPVDLGATRIPDYHHLTLDLVKSLGLELEAQKIELPKILCYGNKLTYNHHVPVVIPSSLPLSKNEQSLGYSGLLQSLNSLIVDLFDPNKNGQASQKKVLSWLDQFSFSNLLKYFNFSPAAIKLIRGNFGSEIDHFSASIYAIQTLYDQKWRKTYRLKKGNQALPQELAKKIRHISYNSYVKAIKQDPHQALVIYTDSHGNLHSLKSDLVLLAISPIALKNIEISPGLSKEKSQAIEQVKMSSVARINYICEKAFWRQGTQYGPLNLVESDLMIERVWDQNFFSPASSNGVLTIYSEGKNASKLASLPYHSRQEEADKLLKIVFPEVLNYVEHTSHYCWSQNRFIGGSWLNYRPGQLNLLGTLSKREGRLFFAGDHTSLMVGWMQGAIESGLTAAQHIKESTLLPTSKKLNRI